MKAINGVDGVHACCADNTIKIEMDEDVPVEMVRAAVEGAGIKVVDA